MTYYNIKEPNEKVDFATALQRGLGSKRGLFYPQEFPRQQAEQLLALELVPMAEQVLRPFVAGSLSDQQLSRIVADAFHFPLPLVQLAPHRYFLELYHGPTLAFKDFGARFMARALAELGQRRVTILTATSGDTGAAVAHAFYGLAQVQVVVLYPQGMVSPLQEKMFATLGGNVHTLAVAGDFDDCQRLVKDAFEHPQLCEQLGLSSANSINMARLIAQMVYYWYAVRLFTQLQPGQTPWFCVPSGNFGNLTAGLMAWQCGLPAAGFVAACNANDTVVRYLQEGKWQPRPTVATLANAMDVSEPSNWERIAEMYRIRGQALLPELRSGTCDDVGICAGMRELFGRYGYLADPHSSCAWQVGNQCLHEDQPLIILSTAHPTKFIETVEEVLGERVPLAPELAAVAGKPVLSHALEANFPALRDFLQQLN